MGGAVKPWMGEAVAAKLITVFGTVYSKALIFKGVSFPIIA